jgi:1-acyl-sn-glycerol-3-phosphate acyltransferase
VIFPEGTRSNSPVLGEFRRGSANIAVKAGVPILPVTVNHTWRMRTGDKGRVSPAEVDIHFHPLVDPASLTPEQREGLSEMLRDIIAGPLGPEGRAAPPL